MITLTIAPTTAITITATVTDGANNNSLTGGNNITSAKTGEVNTALIFGGFVAVLAAAAGVYVFIKRKRAECSEISKIPHPVEFEKYYNL